MFCGFRAGGGVCEQAMHECARRCVLEAAPQGEECGRKNGAHFFRGGHDLPLKHMTLRGYKSQQFLSCGGYFYLPETTAFVHFGLVPAFGNTPQGIFHVGNTP